MISSVGLGPIRCFLSSASVAAFFLAGCSYNQTKPPTPEGLKLIEARTASGTVVTKLEAKSDPNPPRAGQVSIWSLKVFDIKDKPTGERNEWKFFNQLPQSAAASAAGVSAGSTAVLMQAWIISKDGKIFLPQTPTYKAYGSFVTDWTIPKGGDYTIWVRYQPAKRGEIFPTEIARWDFKVAPGENEKPFAMPILSKENLALKPVFTAYDNAGNARGKVTFSAGKFRIGSVDKLEWNSVADKFKNESPSEQELVALSPDGRTFVVFPPDSANGVSTRFAQSGRWKLWFSFRVNGEKYIAPGFLDVS